MNRLIKVLNYRSLSGQGLVETVLFLPILLIILSGLVEFGFLLNEYMVEQDATRNAARFAANLDYLARDSAGDGPYDGSHDCHTTRNFYRQVACLLNQELFNERPEMELDVGTGIDDVIVSVFSVVEGNPSQVSQRHPAEDGELGWSMALDGVDIDKDGVIDYSHRNQSSDFTSAEIGARLKSTTNSGYVLVEVYYSYDQKLRLPWIMAFLDDPVIFHTFAIMPLSSAEPTPTPIP